MRILVLSYEYPPVGGGGSDVCHHIARELTGKGHQVRVLTAHCAGLPFEESIDGYEVRRIRSFRKRPGGCSIPEMFAFVVLASLHGIGECFRFRPHLIHVHHAMPDGPAGLWLSLISRRPYVMTAHGGDVPGFIPALDGFFRRIHWISNFVWRKAAVDVAVAEHLRDLARKSYPKANIIAIPNGVDTDQFRPPAQRPVNAEVRILFAGRFHWQKNVATLVRAIPIVRQLTTRPFRVILYGSGPDQDDLNALVRELDINPYVDFPGWVGREEIASVFQQGDIFCLPSMIEGMPISCAQAMACGLPVVGSDVPGTREEVVDGVTGLLFPPRDHEALGRALAALIDSPEKRAAYGAAGRKRCEEIFSWRRIGEEYEKLFRNVIER